MFIWILEKNMVNGKSFHVVKGLGGFKWRDLLMCKQI